MAFRWLACVVALVLGVLATPTWAEETLKVANGSGEENGYILWGSRDDSGTFTGDSCQIPDVDTGEWNEIVAFTKGRPPALDGRVKWSLNAPVPLDYPDTFSVPVKVWVLCANSTCTGVPASKKTKLAEYLVWANERLYEEHAGFTLTPAEGEWIVDETALGGTAHEVLMDFNANKCAKFENAIQSIKERNAINLYMVDMVDGDRRRGRQCRANHDSAVIGYRISAGTTLHEIGHIFSLDHTDGETYFDDVGGDKNVMSSASSVRRWFTEGQVFRVHFSVDSGFNNPWLSGVPNLPQNRLPRDCSSTTELPCPKVEKMIWVDQ